MGRPLMKQAPSTSSWVRRGFILAVTRKRRLVQRIRPPAFDAPPILAKAVAQEAPKPIGAALPCGKIVATDAWGERFDVEVDQEQVRRSATESEQALV